MYCISINYKTASVSIRERFAFSKIEIEMFITKMVQHIFIKECVVVSTCNRSEVYFTGDKRAVSVMEQAFASFQGIKLSSVLKYYHVYRDDVAVRHLFFVTCGMDSMVLGEDEILGQVKDAYAIALNAKTTGYETNLLFQRAITCSKKIKTNTKISKTPVSIGTLAANEIFRFPKEKKNVLIIGLTGKMGTIIAKNVYQRPDIMIYGTTRRHNAVFDVNYSQIQVVPYEKRYSYINEADIIISATTSPHYTITLEELRQSLTTQKKRLFLDLSVPRDMDQKITSLAKVTLHDMDDFEKSAKQNRQIKEQQIEIGQELLEEELNAAYKELAFHNFQPFMECTKNYMETNGFEKVLFQLKETSTKEEFEQILHAFRRLATGKGENRNGIFSDVC